MIRSLCLTLAALLWAAPALAEDPPCHHHAAAAKALPADAPATDSLFNLKATWTTQGGQKVQLSSLQGQVTVLAMVYASCQAVCPLLVSDMQALEARLPAEARGRVRFVLVSIDPARDTPEKLKAYAQAHHLPPERWTLLTGSADDVRDLAAVLGMKYVPTGSGDFSHSNLITVLGPDGVVRHQQQGLRQDPAPSLQAIQQLLPRG